MAQLFPSETEFSLSQNTEPVYPHKLASGQNKNSVKTQDHGYPTRYSVIHCSTTKGCMAPATRLNKSQSLNKGKYCSILPVEVFPPFRFLHEGGVRVGEGKLHVHKELQRLKLQ